MRDITLDEPLLEYVATGRPPSKAAYPRVLRAAAWLHMDTKGRLWALDDAGGQRRIPPLGERPGLLQEALQNTAFPSGAVLYEHLRPRFYWRGMWGDCAEAAMSSPAR